MPLTFNSRDEHNQRINNALQRLMALTLVPGGWDDDAVNEQLSVFLLKVNEMASLPTLELVRFVSRYKVDFDNMELFADVLAKLSQKSGHEALSAHALGIYEHIQLSNNTFSVDIMSKIKALKTS